MAGSYSHCTDANGKLLGPEELGESLENGGDVYEAVRQLYCMVWLLARGNHLAVEMASRHFEDGVALSPGLHQPEW